MDGVSGRLDQVEYLADAGLARVAAFCGDSRLEAEPHEAKQNGLKYAIVVFVQRTVYEDASVELVALWQISLSARRMGSIDMRVTPPNPTVLPEDEDIAPLISGDPAGRFKRFLPGIEVARDSFGARLANGPLLTARNNILALG